MLRVSERGCDGDPAICTLHCICKLTDVFFLLLSFFFLGGGGRKLLLPKQISRLTGEDCQKKKKKTPPETLLRSAGGPAFAVLRHALHPPLRVFFPLLLSERAKNPTPEKKRLFELHSCNNCEEIAAGWLTNLIPLYLHHMPQHRLWVSPFRDINYECRDTDIMLFSLSPLSPLGKTRIPPFPLSQPACRRGRLQ